MNVSRTINIASSHVVYVDMATPLMSEPWSFRTGKVNNSIWYATCFDFNFDSMHDILETSFPGVSFAAGYYTVSDVLVNLYCRNSQNSGSYKFYKLPTAAYARTTPLLVSDINGCMIPVYYLGSATIDVLGRTSVSASLSSNLMNTWIENIVSGDEYFSIVMVPDTTDTLVEVGGQTLAYSDSSGWSEASNEPTSPPSLHMTFSCNAPAIARFNLYYTSEVPSSSQLTPSNSLGGYRSLNLIYPTTWITSDVGTTDTSIEVYTTTGAPDEGLIQIGPEIASYASVSGNTLQGLTRGIAMSASPSSSSPIPENVRYLELDDLFDTKPLDQESQYRCVAIVNEGAAVASNVQVEVLQDPDADVVVEVGVEVPSFDSHLGVQKGPSGDYIVDNVSFSTGTYSTGKYDGALIYWVNDPDYYGTITSFEYNSGTQTATIYFEGPIVGQVLEDDEYVIAASPSQIVTNDITEPVTNERFSGFLDSTTVELVDHANFQTYDIIYVWIKRTFTDNVNASHDTGAIISLQYTMPNKPVGYSSHILGAWDFDRSTGDAYLTNDFNRDVGLSTYSVISKYDLLTDTVETVYGMDIEDGATWYAGTNFPFWESASAYKFNVNFWWYSPGAIGRTRHITTRETVNKIAPILAKADSSISSGVESITQGEWILCEVGVSDTQNAIRLYLCATGTNPTHVYESEPYDPGLHNVYVSFVANAGVGIVSIEIDGKNVKYDTGPSVLPNTASQLRLNNTAFGNTAYKTTQSGAIISELVVRSDFVDSDDSVKYIRYGWRFVTEEDTFYNRFGYVGIGYEQPSTISTVSIESTGTDIVLARSNGQILRGTRPVWDTVHNFEDSRILPLLKPQNPDNVTISDGKLIVTGTSIRIP